MKIEFIPQINQTIWKRLAAANFILGGAGAGFYMAYALSSMLTVEGSGFQYVIRPELLSVLLVGGGLLNAAFEAGRPWRSLYVFNRACSSWMSREAFLAAIFVTSCLLQWRMPHAALQATCVVIAACFLAAQGYILYTSRAVQAWNSTIMPLLIVISGFYAGCGLNLINYSASGSIHHIVPLLGVIAGISSLTIWLFYSDSVRLSEVKCGDAPNFRKRSLGTIVIGGHLVPIALMALSMAFALVFRAKGLSALIAAGAGVGVLIGSSLQKSRIVLELGKQREIWLESEP